VVARRSPQAAKRVIGLQPRRSVRDTVAGGVLSTLIYSSEHRCVLGCLPAGCAAAVDAAGLPDLGAARCAHCAAAPATASRGVAAFPARGLRPPTALPRSAVGSRGLA
jgi:hypothetical protein